MKKVKAEKKDSKVTEVLFQGMTEGLVYNMIANTILPGSGFAVSGLKKAQNIKKAAKVMGKGAAQKSARMLEGEETEGPPAEELGVGVASEVLTRIGGQSR